MVRNLASRARSWMNWASGLFFIVTGCVELPGSPHVAAVAPPIPAGQARLWFYRDWQPSESLNLANIDVNGSYFGSVANGSAFYRDVPPGYYHVAPGSYNRDFNQDRNVGLAPGQQAYIKILSSQSWDGACRDCMRDTFYAWLISLKTAQVEIACDRNG